MPELVGHRCGLVRSRCNEGADGHCRDVDSLLPERLEQPVSQSADAGFANADREIVRAWSKCETAARQQDRTGVLLFHRWSDRLRSDQRAADIDGEITVETVARLLGEGRLAH